MRATTEGEISGDTIAHNILEAKLATPVKDWLVKESPYIAGVIDLYRQDPKTYRLHKDLERSPMLILKTVLYSAEHLFGLQQSYNRALENVAHANKVSTRDLNEVPGFLQERTTAEQGTRIEKHLARGGKVAIGLMGIGGTGKGTIGNLTGMERAVNVTTRFKRPGEVQGKDYNYIREMEPQVANTLDINTGYNVLGIDQQTGKPILEVDGGGFPINYFDKYGPYAVVVHRQDRARHGTPLSEFTKRFDEGETTMFFEHGPVQVEELAKDLPKMISGAIVVPVCILPPRTGILPLALRVAARTYGDPNHQDTSQYNGYKVKDSYLDSTFGEGQIAEFDYTARFSKGLRPLGIAYIVNDNLQTAVQDLRELAQR